jgi:hypothetical protein
MPDQSMVMQSIANQPNANQPNANQPNASQPNASQPKSGAEGPSYDTAERFARLLTAISATYLFVRISMGLLAA